MYLDSGFDTRGLPPAVEQTVTEAVFAFRAQHDGWNIKAFGPTPKGRFTIWVRAPGKKGFVPRSFVVSETLGGEITAWFHELFEISVTSPLRESTTWHQPALVQAISRRIGALFSRS